MTLPFYNYTYVILVRVVEEASWRTYVDYAESV